MNKTVPHIGFEYPASFQDNELTEDIIAIRYLGYEVDVRKKMIEPMAGLEWAIGTTFVVYLLKPYFEAFLKEAAKDHYEFIKKKISLYIQNKKRIKITTIAASSSPDKLNKKYDQSLSISIRSIIYSGVRITVLINDELEEDELLKAIDQAIDTLFVISKEFALLVDESNKKDKEKPNKSVDLYLIFNKENRTWELLNTLQMLAKYKDR